MNRRTSANFCAFSAFWQGWRVARGDDTGAKNENRDRVMLNFAQALDRGRPLASLGVGLTFVVAWVGAVSYAVLTLLW
jgi:hypothetical protein